MRLVEDSHCKSPCLRFSPWVLALVVLLGVSSNAKADERAEELNRLGKARATELDLEGAAKLFREALAIENDPRYAFNLCYTLEKSGHLREAKEFCVEAQQNGDESVVYKSTQILKRLAARDIESAEVQQPATPAVRPSLPSKPKLRFGGSFGLTTASAGGTDSVSGLNLGVGLIRETEARHSFVLTAELIQRGGEGVSRGFDSSTGTIRASAKVSYFDVSPLVRFAIFRSVYVEGGLNVGLRVYVDSEDFPLEETSLLHYGYAVGLGFGLPISEHTIDIRFRIMDSISNVFEPKDDTGNSTGSPVIAVGAGLWW